MKGISAVIAIVLILMITIALAAMAYLWMTGMFGDISSEGTEQMEETAEGMKASFIIENVKDAVVTVRNNGGVTLTDFSVYVDGSKVDFTDDFSGSLEAGKVGSLDLGTGLTPGEKYDIKITTKQGLAKRKIYDYE